MILSFADVHLGETTYSRVDSDGFYTAELECIRALEYIRARAAQSDIDMIIFTGDFFHTNHPKIRLVKYAIGWLKDMDKLGKPFYIIPGNHDASVYSNALMFMHKLILQNVILIDSYDVQPKEIKWNSFKLLFLPYVQDTQSKNKDAFTYDQVEKLIEKVQDNTIVVTHIVEPKATTGSEAYMFSKKVVSVDLDTHSKYKKLIYLLGHIHRPQIYKKSNGATVVYPGSVTANDMSDLNQVKGYVLIAADGTITHEPILGIRKFVRYFIPDGKTAEEFLSTTRLITSSVIFLESNAHIDFTKELNALLISKNIIVGKTIITEKLETKQTMIYETLDPFAISAEYIKSLQLQDEQNYIEYCHNKINQRIGA